MQQSERRAWFLAQVKPNSAGIAERNLARQGFATFLPRIEETVRRRGRFCTALKPLFPGYVFVRFDPGAGQWPAINATQGITQLVRFGRDPVPVPPHAIDAIRQRCDETGTLTTDTPPKQGDSARIVLGPFADFVGRVIDTAPEGRVWLLLDVMGQKTRIAATRGALRRA